jgi:tetratricopeptide (TPR) repeat protein
VFIRQGSPDKAAELCLKALTIQRELDDRRELGATLNSLGEAVAALGRVDEAVFHLSEALTAARDAGDRRIETGAYLHLARCHQLSGQIPDAMRSVKRALALAHEIGDRFREAKAQWYLGLLFAEQDPALARSCLESALATFQIGPFPEADRVATDLAGLPAATGTEAIPDPVDSSG